QYERQARYSKTEYNFDYAAEALHLLPVERFARTFAPGCFELAATVAQPDAEQAHRHKNAAHHDLELVMHQPRDYQGREALHDRQHAVHADQHARAITEMAGQAARS